MNATFASILYWSRSALNAGDWLPCLLCLDGKQVELVSERGLELRCVASDLGVGVTALSGPKLATSDASFVLSAVGGRAVPLPLPSLEARLTSFRKAHPDSPKESIFDPVSQWQRLLVEAGARPRGWSRSHLRLLLGVAITVLVAVFVGLGLVTGYAATR